MTKLKNLKLYQTQELKLWPNSKTQLMSKLKKNNIFTKLKNCDNCDKIKKKNSNCDQTQKLKLWQNSNTQIVTELKNSNFDKTLKFKSWKH